MVEVDDLNRDAKRRIFKDIVQYLNLDDDLSDDGVDTLLQCLVAGLEDLNGYDEFGTEGWQHRILGG